MTRARGASRPRFRLLPTVALTLAILLLPTVVYAWGRNSSSFAITTITVTGTHLVPKKQALQLLSSAYAGRNLFTVTGGDVRRTLAPLCFISGASIDRDFPDTLVVTLEEHDPVAYGLAGERWYVLDRDGHVVCRAAQAAEQLGGRAAATPSPSASSAPGEDTAGGRSEAASDAGEGGAKGIGRLIAGPKRAVLPLPRIAIKGRVREGSVVDDPAAADMLHVIAALPRSLQRGLAAVEDDDGRITLRFAGGPVVVWGDAERTVAKTVALRTVLKEYTRAGKMCTRMDVSIPDRTLAKPVLK
jgi:cell division septal protein FtsQ